jgi:hypothetical protein
MNFFLFSGKPPTSRHFASDSMIVVGIGIEDELAEHWAQGYHRRKQASSKDFH